MLAFAKRDGFPCRPQGETFTSTAPRSSGLPTVLGVWRRQQRVHKDLFMTGRPFHPKSGSFPPLTLKFPPETSSSSSCCCCPPYKVEPRISNESLQDGDKPHMASVLGSRNKNVFHPTGGALCAPPARPPTIQPQTNHPRGAD